MRHEPVELSHAVAGEPATQPPSYRYSVYGISLRSEVPLSLPEAGDSGFAEIDLSIGSPELFADAVRGATLGPSPTAWYRRAHLPDGSTYVRWEDLGEFLVSGDGRRITLGVLRAASQEAFQVYLLGQALSFALVKRGLEPLHATSVVVNGSAVAFLGGSGFGKSSLAASFLDAGHHLLTDDLLLLRENGHGFYAYPGPPRIKLFPKLAREFLKVNSGGVPMNGGTKKLVMPLVESQIHRSAAPLKLIYVLNSPRNVFREQRVSVSLLSRREAFVRLLENTFNRSLTDSARLERQFRAMARLAAKVPVALISYPRVLGCLPEVRQLILSEAGVRG